MTPTSNEDARPPRAFVTGTSSGLGRAIAANLLEQGWQVFGCSRRASDVPGLLHRSVDLGDLETVPDALNKLLNDASDLSLVVLNAGMLGEIRDIGATPLDDLQRVMTLNVWANKVILDWLLHWQGSIDQIVMISSGASILGNRGWGGYALSKATLNMLAKLYAHEFSQTHLASLAPGIIDTAMMDTLCDHTDADTFPAVKRLQDARGTPAMPGPESAADRVVSVLPELRKRPSGSFVDIREILEPEAYSELYGR